MEGKKFIRLFFASETIGFMFGVPVATAYALLLVDFDALIVEKLLRAVGIATAVIVCFMAVPTNFILTRNLSREIDTFQGERLSSLRTIHLFERLVRLPFRHGLWIFIRISLGALAVTLYGAIHMEICLLQAVSIFMLAVYGAYIAGLTAFMGVRLLIQGPCRQIIANGELPPEQIGTKGHFGLSFVTKAILFLVIPVVYSNFSVYLTVLSCTGSDLTMAQFKPKLLGVLAVNIITITAAILLIITSVHRKIRVLDRSLDVFVSSAGDLTRTIPTDLSDDFERISYQINRAVESFRILLRRVKESGGVLFQSAMEITDSSQGISANSNRQALSVKKIVASMEDAEERSGRIAGDIGDVAQTSLQTREDVEKGFSIIHDNLVKMEMIKQNNSETVHGIRDLNERIKNIWEIVGIINSIAYQTKIIAFNAELEATAAEGEGRNFEIVAGEVRRLADNTVESTEEIRSMIQEIQTASENLILSTEADEEKVREGWERSRDLELLFKKIRASSERSSDSASRITESVTVQASAFEQILNTVKQISEGTDGFAESTAGMSEAALSLQETAEYLNSIVEQYIV